MPEIPRKVRLPRPATLKRYGLSADEWLAMFRAQGGVCPICKRVPPSGLWATDHEHIRKKQWRKLKPAERKRYVRGVVCSSCNHRCLGYLMTLDKAKNVVAYLKAYERRRPKR